MCCYIHVQVFILNFHSNGSFRIGEVARCHDVGSAFTFVLSEHDNGCLAVLADVHVFVSATVAHNVCTWADKVGEVFQCKEFWCVAHSPGLAIYLYQRILCPAPGGNAVVGKQEVPDVVFITAATQIVADEEEGVFAGFPIHAAVATFAFCADEMQLWVKLHQFGQTLATFPLGTKTFDHLQESFVGENLFDVILSVGVECTYIQFHFGVVLLQRGCQIVAVKTDGALSGPGTTRIGCVAVGFVLIHHFVYLDALFGIQVNEFAELFGIGLQVAFILNEVVL